MLVNNDGKKVVDKDTDDVNNDKDIKDDIFDDFEELTFSDYLNANEKSINEIHKEFLKTIYSKTEEREEHLLNNITEISSENTYLKEKLKEYETMKIECEEIKKKYTELSESHVKLQAEATEKDKKLRILKRYQDEVNIDLLPYEVIVMLEELKKGAQSDKSRSKVFTRLAAINDVSDNTALKEIVKDKIDNYKCTYSNGRYYV